jgi:hypothetical protein
MRTPLPAIAIAACLQLALSATACWPSEDPIYIPPTGSCNHNGTCELDQQEESVSCPDDCPPCNAIEALTTGDVQAPENAVGKPDNAMTVLGPGSVVVLQVGREIYNETGPDFTLVGEITSESSVTVDSEDCTTNAPDSGAFVVEVSLSGAGSEFEQVGYWAKTSSSAAGGTAGRFNLSCAEEVRKARYVRLIAQSDATAKLDAIEAQSCVQ